MSALTLARDATIAVPAGASIDPFDSKAEAPSMTLVASLIVTAAPVRGVWTHRTCGERAAKVLSPSLRGRVSTTMSLNLFVDAARRRTFEKK